jgi:hypothetical protein
MWDKLSNSEDPLKLLIPNYSFKSTIINNILRVIIQKILAKEMGDCGSKSDLIMSVKEQRVDGS